MKTTELHVVEAQPPTVGLFEEGRFGHFFGGRQTFKAPKHWRMLLELDARDPLCPVSSAPDYKIAALPLMYPVGEGSDVVQYGLRPNGDVVVHSDAEFFEALMDGFDLGYPKVPLVLKSLRYTEARAAVSVERLLLAFDGDPLATEDEKMLEALGFDHIPRFGLICGADQVPQFCCANRSCTHYGAAVRVDSFAVVPSDLASGIAVWPTEMDVNTNFGIASCCGSIVAWNVLR
jgi:hypothetical protein